MKSSERRKTDAAEAAQTKPEAEKPVWFLGKEVNSEPGEAEYKAEAEEPAAVDEAEEPQRRPSQLQSYMRYAKMREPREADDTLTPVKAKRFALTGVSVSSASRGSRILA